MEVSMSSMERIEHHRREDVEAIRNKSFEMSSEKVEDHDSDYITTASPHSSKSTTPDGIQDEREQHLSENREQVFVALESLGVVNLKVNSFDHRLNCHENDSDNHNDEIAEDIVQTELGEIQQAIDLDVDDKSSSDLENAEVPPEELELEPLMSQSYPHESHAHQRRPTIIRAHRTSRPTSKISQAPAPEKDPVPKSENTNKSTSRARFHKAANRGKIFHISKAKPKSSESGVTHEDHDNQSQPETYVQPESEKKHDEVDETNSRSPNELDVQSSPEESSHPNSDVEEEPTDESEDLPVGEQLERKIQTVKSRFQNLVTRGQEWTKNITKPDEIHGQSDDETDESALKPNVQQSPTDQEANKELDKDDLKQEDTGSDEETLGPIAATDPVLEPESNPSGIGQSDTKTSSDDDIAHLKAELEETIRGKEILPTEAFIPAPVEHDTSHVELSQPMQDSKEFVRPKPTKPSRLATKHSSKDKKVTSIVRLSKPTRKPKKQMEQKYESDFDSDEVKQTKPAKGTPTRKKLTKSKKMQRAVDESKFYGQWISPRVSRQEVRTSLVLDQAAKEEFRHIISSVLDERTPTVNQDDMDRGATSRLDRTELMNGDLTEPSAATAPLMTTESPSKDLLDDHNNEYPNDYEEEEDVDKGPSKYSPSSNSEEYMAILRHIRKESEPQHKYSLAGHDEILNEYRRKVCLNLRENLNGLKMNQKMPHFFRDRTTAFFGIIHSAVFGSEDLQPEEAELILGINKDTIDQLAKYEQERNVIEKQIASTVSLDDEDSSHDHTKSEVHMSRKRNESVNPQPSRKPRNQGVPRTPLPRVRQLKEQFRTFAKFGDRHNDGTHITLSRCDKWLRQSGVIDETLLTTTDTAILFRRMSKTHVWMTFREFQKFLKALAKSKALDLKLIMNALVACGAPQYGKITVKITISTPAYCYNASLMSPSMEERIEPGLTQKGVAWARQVDEIHGTYIGSTVQVQTDCWPSPRSQS
ncbi:hypothetical protein TCAL_10963 [Tigriopus californicus]|uniref:EF-hand domain-containing protein n=1 Tax=Tigriopus californicus TaxID=6832 RepID=A0A553PSA5_TIGCA|nr:hypothetical protein TCAL_10963 [Tigriopus californicus]